MALPVEPTPIVMVVCGFADWAPLDPPELQATTLAKATSEATAAKRRERRLLFTPITAPF